MSTYKLYYFNGRGRAEVCRLIFAAAGQKFEDIRYDFGEWSSHKAEMPLGQMPVLEFDGVQLSQSLSIARFLAKQFQLAGKDNFEQAKVDAVVDTMLDLNTKVVPIRLEKDEAKKKELAKKFLDEELPKHLQNSNTLGKLYGNGGPYFVGNQLTLADLYFHHTGQTVLEILNGNCLDNYAWLQQNRAEVEKQPRIAEYLKNRAITPY
jgi:prostaglandin-H2 D-isomerase / glutathione transferase